jgi:RHS repeat-associated protein
LSVRRQLEYGEDGHIRTIQDSLRGALTVSYDDLDRLVGVDGARSERYTFDRASNIVSSHRVAASRIESSDQLRRLEGRAYDYDPIGRVTRIRERAQSWQLHYNAKGEVAAIDLPDGGTVHYEYDPLGRRIEKRFEGGSRGGRRVRFVWNGGDVFKEEVLADADLTAERFYLFSTTGPRARIDRDADGRHSALYYHNDHVGTPQFCTDDSGRIVWTSQGDSYGYEAVRPGAIDDQNIRLPGQYFDEETGLHYNRFRYYDPISARYLQPDPIDTLTNPNRFSYPLDPLGAIDPLGLNLLVLNADPGDKTNTNYDLYASSGQLTNLPKFRGVDGYAPPGSPPGQVGNLLDPNLGSLTNYDHIVIHAHGSPTSIAVGKPGLWARIRRKLPGGRYISGSMGGKELAALLKSKGFAGKVTVVACSTGGSNGSKKNFAQELADGLGAGSEVVAWDEAIIVDPNTGRGAATWNMGEAVRSIDEKMLHATRGQTWDTMPESWGRWTFKSGQPPVPG